MYACNGTKLPNTMSFQSKETVYVLFFVVFVQAKNLNQSLCMSFLSSYLFSSIRK